MLTTRSMDNLMPYVRYLAKKLIAESAKIGIPIIVTATMRDAEYQAQCYAKGTSKTKDIGPHAFGLAFDVCINSKTDAYNAEKLKKVGAIGKKLGLVWGGDWKSIVDMPHFEYTMGLTAADLRAGKRKELPAVPGEVAPVVVDTEKTPMTIRSGGLIFNGFAIDGVTYAPVRSIAEALGKTVGWDKDKPGEVTIK